jgi:hypothetical protein
MIIERTKKEVVFRLPVAKLTVDDLQAVVDWVEFKSLSKKSKASQKQVDELVKEIKKGRWNKTKAKIGL